MWMRFKIKTFRNPHDFIFGSWRYEHQSDGGMIKYGRLKRDGNESKYQEIYRVD